MLEADRKAVLARLRPRVRVYADGSAEVLAPRPRPDDRFLTANDAIQEALRQYQWLKPSGLDRLAISL